MTCRRIGHPNPTFPERLNFSKHFVGYVIGLAADQYLIEDNLFQYGDSLDGTNDHRGDRRAVWCAPGAIKSRLHRAWVLVREYMIGAKAFSD